jgi:hypothetical protein
LGHVTPPNQPGATVLDIRRGGIPGTRSAAWVNRCRYAANMGEVFRWVCGGLAILALGIFAFFIALDFLARFLIYREEKRLRRKLQLVVRFIPWADIEANFSAGTGTLIVEHCGPKGPIRATRRR